MSIDTRLKTFVNPNHLVLEGDFNLWVSTLDSGISVVNTSMSYSAALQKFVLAVVYTIGECKCVPPIQGNLDV